MTYTGDGVDDVYDTHPNNPVGEEARMPDYKVVDFPKRTVAYVRVSQGYDPQQMTRPSRG